MTDCGCHEPETSRRKRFQARQLEGGQAAVVPGAAPAILCEFRLGHADESTAVVTIRTQPHRIVGTVANARNIDARHEVAARRQAHDEGRRRFQ